MAFLFDFISLSRWALFRVLKKPAVGAVCLLTRKSKNCILAMNSKYKVETLNMLAIRLPAEVETRLEALAQSTGRTKSFYAREAILEHLDDLEDLYLAEQRLSNIRAGKSLTCTLDEVERDLDLGD